MDPDPQHCLQLKIPVELGPESMKETGCGSRTTRIRKIVYFFSVLSYLPDFFCSFSLEYLYLLHSGRKRFKKIYISHVRRARPEVRPLNRVLLLFRHILSLLLDSFFWRATYVAHFVFLVDVWIRTQSSAVASRCATP
jgi:hypothetical protein